ncbi:MAG: type II toxin-antitoxin system prevent-host-death family antitoxin [Beijerinckiaceae bacterium]|nr:MAG: type II toxin-antitoxin system prevent-host-death family antitoxin [Beijerinckiaceae bacterium]
MKALTAKDAKCGFGRLIDLAGAEPAAVAKRGRPVVVVMAVEEYERKSLCLGQTLPTQDCRGRRRARSDTQA